MLSGWDFFLEKPLPCVALGGRRGQGIFRNLISDLEKCK